MAVSSDAIRSLVEPALAASGLELWDVEVSRDAVRVLVDRPGGIDLDALADLAGHVVSPLLDEHPDLTPAGHFSLEVSSPGVERTLRRPEHYLRYIGTDVSVKTTETVSGSRRHHGRLLAADEGSITVQPEDAPADEPVVIPMELLDRARTVVVWGPAPKPGQAAGPKRSKACRASKETQAVKRSAADGRVGSPGPALAGEPVASNDAKDTAL